MTEPLSRPCTAIHVLWARSEAVGGRLSSDQPGAPAGSSAHFDSWEAQPGHQQDQLTRCLNDPNRNNPSAPLCGIFSATSVPWLAPLNAWANTIGYVNSDGNAGAMPPPTP
jgi:hypothetical protein